MTDITIIAGATASGKTAYSLDYAKNFQNAIIINADASAVYKDFPILTAQPQNKNDIRHLLFEICDISEHFSANKWLLMCEEILHSSEFANYHKIIVGGSCMYLFLLINGLIQSPEILLESRERSIEVYNKIGHKEFLSLVLKYDNHTKTDKQRLINNYALKLQTGKSFSEWQKEPKKIFIQPHEYELIKINPPREQIYQNCNNRFLQMLQNGAEQEMKNAINKFGFEYDFKKILCANEIRDYLKLTISKDRMIELATQKTRNLAKSQITWIRNKL